jgi:hypothetical protein
LIQIGGLLLQLRVEVLFRSSLYQRGVRARFGAPSLLQFRNPAFHCACNFSPALTTRLFLIAGLQVLQFSSSALYYLHHRIHVAITPSISICLAGLSGSAQYDE